MDLILLVAAFIVILAGAELFTNGIEWFGRKLELAEGAVGSVLAAVGTAMPETMIPLIAILIGGGSAAKAVGIGAILGAPFMLSTLAMFVTGIAVISVGRSRLSGDSMPVDPVVLWRDVRYFAVAYGIAIAAALLPIQPWWPKIAVAAGLLGMYAWYVKEHFEADPAVDADELVPLRLHRLDRRAWKADPVAPPRLRVVNLQVVVALAFIVLGAYTFVGAVEHLSTSLGVNETILALVIAPIATELPEKFNSIIWIRAGKDTLAMGNITGAMVFQSTIPTVVALVFASQEWALTGSSAIAFGSAVIAFLSCAAIFYPMARRGRLNGRGLLAGGAFYLAYLGLIGAHLAGLLG